MTNASSKHIFSPTIMADASLTPEEVALISSTFSSYKTTFYVSSSLVNLYTSTPSSPWTLRYTGVPTLLLNCGGSRARTQRGLQNRWSWQRGGHGLPCGRTSKDNLGCYAVDKEDKLFHSLHYSRDHMVRVGLSWEQEEDADIFLARVEDLTSSPENLGLSGPKTRLRVPGKRKTKLDKVEISRPCEFRHNVSITMEDKDTFHSMMANIDKL